MRPPLPKPCKACPFRRKSAPGWLGASTPEEFLREQTLRDLEMPCHSTVDYENPWWRDRLDQARFCAGALIFFANICKLSRDPSRPRLPKSSEVFASPQEFLEHHLTPRKA